METIELIELELQEFNRLSHTVDRVKRSADVTPTDTAKSISSDCDVILNRTHNILSQMLEWVADRMNMVDMLTPVDVKLSEIPFSLIQKETNEDDYE
jgi:hypothetical protein